jgi:hypothetical protein
MLHITWLTRARRSRNQRQSLSGNLYGRRLSNESGQLCGGGFGNGDYDERNDMSDKLTPRQRDKRRIQTLGRGEAFEMLQNDRDALLVKLAAVEAERDEAAALLREVAETLPPNYEPGELTPYWVWCGGNMWLKHEATCIIERIRIWLAKQEANL